ncbi:myelin regulatory factor-like protein isoform X2 [Culicoides brevitarsis]|uniref:myelin regulatory factor-like protein isoform X2 n=1 Tax=Culicoides brevitarsis TaxID=469753 RepID=UPI00307C957F
MDFIEDPMFANDLGRSDFIGGIDNEALDFEQFDAFIHGNSSTGSTDTTNAGNALTQATHLPESPPDSGSEPPYSPSDLHSAGVVNVNVSQPTYDADISLGVHHYATQQQQQASSLHVSDLTLSQQLLSDPAYTSPSPIDATGLIVVPEVTLKHEGELIISDDAPNGQQYLQQPQPGSGVTLIELGQRPFKNDLLVEGGASNDDLVHQLMPSVYATTTNASQSTENVQSSRQTSRKRKGSSSIAGRPPSAIIKTDPETSRKNCQIEQTSLDASLDTSSNNGGDTSDSPMQSIRFAPFQQHQWHHLCNQNLQELPMPHYRVDADKGFNFSNSDDAFVCQKKNHFQITVHAQLHGSAVFVRTNAGLEKIRSFHLHFYGVKLEAPNQTIRIEQSQSDRSKKPFHPVPVDLHDGQVSKVTVGRLHFSETTNNNMRKKGRPNPEQRYFQLVVGLHAHTHSGNFPIVSQGSERIIVRASNPGQFENDVELCWQRGVTLDSIYHSGRVGINTDRPDESLVIHGNLKISGHIVQPSDSRAKREISELDTSQQLENVQKIRVVKYCYEPEFALHSGLVDANDTAIEITDTGVIAQEVQKVLPDAVQPAGSIILPNGQIIDNFLLVNKDRIFMENIGAVKELCKVTGSLETRIEQLERINARLLRIQKHKRSKSSKDLSGSDSEDDTNDFDAEICSNKTIQFIIIVLIIIMTVCLTAISTLYLVERPHKFTNLSPLYDINDKRIGSSSGNNQHEWINPPEKPLHTTFSFERFKPTTKPFSLSKDSNTKSPEELIKTTRVWGPIAPSEAEDPEIASNAIDGTQYEEKKNETTKSILEAAIIKNHETKTKSNIYFRGHGPETPQDAEEIVEEKILDNTPILVHVLGEPHYCKESKGSCPSLCCDDSTNHNLEKKTCFKETEEINSNIKYNVTAQQDGVIDLVTHLISNSEPLLGNSTLHDRDDIETPINPKENDGLEPQDLGCYDIRLTLLTNSFNDTISTRKICNVDTELEKQTIIVPISRYMRDAQMELLFITPKIKQWSLCEHKTKSNEFSATSSSNTLDASGNQIYPAFSPKELTKPSFSIQIPHGNFERELEFRTLLKSTTKSVCQLSQESTGLFLQYNIKIYRECN